MDRPGTQEGFVFCAKIADHPRPEFRYVPIEDGKVRTVDGKPEVIGELLTSLEQADPRDPNTPAGDPSADLREKLYTTWEIAQADIYEDWTRRTDPAEFEPQVPKAMRDAAALVRKHGAVLGDEQDRLVERLNQVANPRAEKEIRGILAVQQNGDVLAGLTHHGVLGVGAGGDDRLLLGAHEVVQILEEGLRSATQAL